MPYSQPQLVSVVMLNYNGLKYLKRTILPILNLDYANYEFIIVDNGSTDGSIEFIKEFKKIRIIQSPKIAEKNFACNYAIDKARGKYILLLDNDIIIKSNQIINELVTLSKTKEKVGEIGLAFFNEGEELTTNYGEFLGYYFTKQLRAIEANKLKKYNGKEISYADGIGIFIKKSVWKEVNGYEEHLKFGGDDNDLGIRLWLMGYKNYLFANSFQVHIGLLERKDNKKYSLKFKEMFYANLYTIGKNFRFSNMLLTLIGHSIIMFLKSIKQSVFRLNTGPFFAFFQGFYLFLRNLPSVIKKRKEIQSKRVVKDDIFLKIIPPKFD